MTNLFKLDDLRIKLDQLAEKIISKLKDRSRYKLNPDVYTPGKARILKKNVSLFEYALKAKEKYYAKLGRYDFPDQEPITKNLPCSNIKRKLNNYMIPEVKLNLYGKIIGFYINSLKEFCKKGNDLWTQGETADCDAEIIETLHERINLGKFVAESKLKKNPSLINLKGEKLEKALRNEKREKEVILNARKMAKKYDFNEKVAEKYFKWIIQETLNVEIAYMRSKNGNN